MSIADRLPANRQYLILDYVREFPIVWRRHAGPRDIADRFQLTPDVVRAERNPQIVYRRACDYVRIGVALRTLINLPILACGWPKMLDLGKAIIYNTRAAESLSIRG